MLPAQKQKAPTSSGFDSTWTPFANLLRDAASEHPTASGEAWAWRRFYTCSIAPHYHCTTPPRICQGPLAKKFRKHTGTGSRRRAGGRIPN